MKQRAQVEKEISDLGALSIEEKLFSHGTFWAGSLEKTDLNLAGVFFPEDTLSHSVFDLASTTKALATTPLVLREVWSQGLTEEAMLGEVFSRGDFFGFESARKLKISDVLRHESGIPAWRNFYVECEQKKRDPKAVFAEVITHRHLDHRNVYSDIGMIMLGKLLESARNRPLSEIFMDFATNELNFDLMQNKIGPSWLHKQEVCVDTGFCAIRQRILKGEVHDENAWALGGYTGHTGLFSTTETLAKYLRALYASPIGRRVIRENTRWASQFPSSDSALGWRTARDASSKAFGEGRGIGHMGFTGTAFWIDPKTNLFGIILTNRVALARVATLPKMREFRAAVFGKMFDAFRGQLP